MSASEPAATLLLCAHGARGVAGAAARHAAVLERERHVARVTAAALYGAPRLEDVLAGLAPGPLAVLPFMMADGHTRDVLRERLERVRPDARLLPALGGHPDMAPALLRRAKKGLAAHGRRPASTALLLVGHGTRRHPGSNGTAYQQAATIDGQRLFAEVAVAFLDEPPSVGEAVAELASPFVVAVGFLTDAGTHGARDVAELLRQTGRPGVYLGPIGPDPAMRPLILATAGLATAGLAPALQ